MATEDEQKLELLEASLMLNPRDPHKWLWLARQQRKMSRLDDARKSCGRALGIDPKFADAHYELGLVDALVGDEAAAEAGFARSIECNATHFGAHEELANRCEAAANWEAAANHVEAMAVAKPEDVATSRRAARLWVRIGRFPAATVHLERAVAVAPNDIEVRGELARCRAAQQEWQKTVDELEGIALAALQVDALLALALAREELAQPSLAAQAYEVVLEKDAEHQEAIVGVGRTCLVEKDFSRARVMFARAVEKEPRRAELHALHAEALQGLADYEGALGAATRGVEADPTSAASHEAAGLALNALRRFDDAVSAFGRALRYDAKRLRSLIGVAEAHERLDQGERAVAALSEAIALAPSDAALRERSAELLHRLGHTARALSGFRDAVRLEPTRGAAHRGIGRCAVDLERFSDAIDALRQAIEIDPKDVAALRLLGTAERALGKAMEAAESFERATRLDPGDAQTWQALGASMLEAGRLGPALDALEKAQSLKQSDATERLMATALMRSSRFEDAVPVFERIVARAPDDAPWWRELGRAHRELGRGEAAREALGKAARLRRTDAGYFFEHGQVCLSLGDFDGAIESLERARQLDPNDVETAVALGRAYDGRGRFADAVSVLEVAVGRDPSLVMGQRALGHALGELGRWSEARERLQKAVELVGDDGATHHELGLLLVQLGEDTAAVGHLEQAVLLAPERIEALRALARAEGRLGRHQDALMHYRKLLRHHPDDVAALLEVADASERLGRDEDALGFLEQAQALEPKKATQRRIGLLQARLGRDRLAAETLAAALGGGADESAAYAVLATCHERLGNIEAALVALSTSARLAEQAASAEAAALHRRLGFLLAQAEREPQAIEALERARALGDQDVETASRLGALHRAAGERALEERDFAAAAAHLEHALEAEFDAALCQQLATAQLELGRAAEAVALLKRGQTAFPEAASLASFLGRTLLELGDAEGASKALQAALALEPRAFDELWLAARAAERLGRRAEAIGLLVRAAEQRPEAAEVFEQLGQHYYDEGRVQDALGAWEKVLVLRPLDARASYEAGRCQRDLGNDEASAAHFARALIQSPDDPLENYELGAARARLGQVQAAIGPLENALELEPTHQAARELLARCLAKVERDEEAAAMFARCLEARFEVELCLEYARCLLRIERWIELERAADRILGTAPGHGEALQLRARALDAQGRNDEALKALRLAAAEGDDPRAREQLRRHLLERAQAHTSLGDAAAAAAAYREALGLLPSDLETHLGLARSLRAAGRLQLALDAARAGLAVDAKCVELWVMSAQLLALGGVLDEALVAYRAALELAPENAVAWLGLAEVHERKAALDEADEALARAAALPEPLEALRRRRKLLERLDRPETLAEVLTRLRALGELDGEGLLELAELEHGLGRHRDVVNRAQAALAELGERARGLFLLGAAHRALGEEELAARVLSRLVELEPEHREGWALLARAELALEAWERAVASCERALGFSGQDVELWQGLARAEQRLGRREEQARALRSLIALSPSTELQRELGLLLDELGAADAETHLEVAASERPEDREVRGRLAALLLGRAERQRHAGDLASALELLERAAPHAHHDGGLCFRAASELRAVGRPERALSIVGRAVELAPSDVEALTLEGELRFETSAFEGAVASFRRAVDVEADCVPALHGMGRAWLALQKAAEAEAALRRAATIRPDSKELWSLLTDALVGQSKRNEACESQHRVVRLVPKDRAEQLRLAELLMEAGRFAEAVEVLGPLHAAASPRAEVALPYAKGLLEVDRMRDAVEVATAALEAGQPSAEQAGALWQVRAVALEELDEADDALLAHERARELGRVETLERFRGLLRRRAREVALAEPGRAAGLFERALGLGSRDAETLVELARAWRDAGELQGALDAVREALALEPTRFAARLLLAELEAALGRHELAVTAFESALAEGRESAEAWLGLGLSRLALGSADGVAALERSVELRPTREALEALAAHHRASADEGATLAALERWLRLGPLVPERAAELATLRVAHGRPSEALLVVEDALAATPGHAGLLLAKGRAAAASGHPRLAREAFEALLELQPEHDLAHGLLGRVLLELAEVDAAVRAFERQVLLTPTTEWLELLADALGRAGDEARRREVLARLSRAFHEDPGGLLRIAQTHRDAGRPDEAIATLERAHRLAPEDPAIRLGLAELLLAEARRGREQGRSEQALTLLSRAEQLRLEPAQLRALAELYAALDEGAPARRVVESWLALEPRSVEALTLMGELRARAGEVDAALEGFERALAIDSDALRALRGAGFLLQSQQQPRQAAEKLLRALRLEPGARDVAVAAVASASAVGDDEVSERSLRELVRLLPREPSARRELAIVLGRREAVAEGLEQLDVALELDPGDAAAWVARANLSLQAGRPQQALAAATRALELAPAEAAALRALGLARAQSGEAREALEPLEQAYRENPTPELARRLSRLHAEHGLERSAQGAHELATVSLLRALELGDEALATRLGLARSLAALGQSQRVIDALRDRLELTRENLPGWLLLGEAYARSGQWPRAAEAFDVAMELDAESFDALLGGARVAVQLGDLDLGAAYFERAIAVRPADAEVRREMVRHYETLKDADAVLRHLEALGDPATLEDDELKRLGILLSKRKRDVEAERVLEQAVERGLADVATLDALTEVKARRDPKSAVELAQRLVELEPSHLAGWVRLARGSSAALDAATAERAYERAIQLEPSKDLLAELAALQAAAPEAARRIETLRRLVERYPDDAEHTAALGLELARRGQSDAAQALSRALDLGTSNPEVRKSLYRLTLDEARRLQTSGQPRPALEVALRANGLLPAESEAKLLVAELHEALGEVEAAIDALRGVLALEATNVEALTRLGAIGIARAEPQAAIPRLRRAAELDPDHIESLRLLADAEGGLGRLDAAIGALERLLQRAPSDLLAKRQLIRHLLSAGLHARALELCREALESAPSDVPLQLDLARSLHGRGQRDEAIGVLERVVELESDNLVAQKLLVELLREKGQLERLAPALKKLFRLDKKRESLLELEQCAHKLEEPELLLWTLRELTALTPSDAAAFARLGEALNATGRVNEAIQKLDRAVALDPNTPWLAEALVRVCWAAARQKRAEHDHRSAVEYYEKAVRHAKNGPTLAYEYADALRRVKSPRAGEAMKAALRTAIANPSAGAALLPELGAAFFEMQDYPAAVQAYHQVCQLRPDDLDLQRALISALLHAGKRAEAVEWMRHALRIAPRDEALLFSLGIQYVALGRMNEVRDVWTALSPLNPELAQQLWTASTARR